MTKVLSAHSYVEIMLYLSGSQKGKKIYVENGLMTAYFETQMPCYFKSFLANILTVKSFSLVGGAC